MNALLLVCDQVTFQNEEKFHILGKVLNDIQVPVFPYVIELNIFIKISNFEKNETLEQYVEVIDEQNQVLGGSSPAILRNYRGDDQISGIDTSGTISLVVNHTGILFVNMYLNGVNTTTYPITIRRLKEK